MARPRKEDKEKRKIRHTINFTEAEYNKAAQKAEKLNMNFIEYLRNAAIKTKIQNQKPKHDYQNLRAELGKIGSNLNQITRKVNQVKKLSKEDKKRLNQIYLEFNQIKEELQK